MKLYKWLSEDGCGRYSGFQWPLPKNGPGKWVRVKGEIIKCRNGIHACREQDLIHWIGPKLWELEAPGKVYDWGDKVGVRLARLLRPIETWNERTARLFACDCVSRAFGYIEEPDPRSVEAITVSRRFALGRATDEELAAAARAASAVTGAASVAPWAAADAATGEELAIAAAMATAGAALAAYEAAMASAATTAAYDAAMTAEWTWQTDRLLAYLDGRIDQ